MWLQKTSTTRNQTVSSSRGCNFSNVVRSVSLSLPYRVLEPYTYSSKTAHYGVPNRIIERLDLGLFKTRAQNIAICNDMTYIEYRKEVGYGYCCKGF